ncbi:MAG: GatB/YqeY domain-containing protein [Alphaproteobacteria bacterium]|nr:GatB/YqeY domain-containing protein [Alphaproteobacteria bacterium]
MMRDQFNTALKEAMKAGDKRRVGTLRLINAALKDRDIEARGAGRERATDDEILQLLQKMIKQRNESIETYEKAGRDDLATQEREEKEIIEAYLPQQMSANEVRAAAMAAVRAVGAASIKDMGKVMTELKANYAGRMDFSKANAVVKELLTQ